MRPAVIGASMNLPCKAVTLDGYSAVAMRSKASTSQAADNRRRESGLAMSTYQRKLADADELKLGSPPAAIYSERGAKWTAT